MVTVRISSDGIGAMIDDIDGIVSRLENTEPLLNKIAIMARREFKANFVQGGRDPHWRPLADSTKLQKGLGVMMGVFPRRSTKTLRKLQGRLSAGRGGSAPITTPLVASGALMESATQRGSRGNVHRLSGDKRSLEVGSQFTTSRGAPLASIHNEGTGPYDIHAGGNVGARESPYGMAKLGIVATRGRHRKFVGGPPGGSGKKMLRFLGRDPKTGQITWIYRAKVRHPGVPQRQFIYVPPEGLDEMANAAVDFIAGGAQEAGD